MAYVFRNSHQHVCGVCRREFTGPMNAKHCQRQECQAEAARRRAAKKWAKAKARRGK